MNTKHKESNNTVFDGPRWTEKKKNKVSFLPKLKSPEVEGS